MAYNRNHARNLCNASEFSLFEASAGDALRKHTPTQLRAKLERSRKLRDKQQDLLRRQRLASRKRTGTKGGTSGVANVRTEQKLKLFGEMLSRFEDRLRQVEKGEGRGAKAAVKKAAASTRKAPAKKAQPKKTATKKAAAKKTAAKKTATKKAAAKKTTARKTTAKKAATRKTAPSKAATTKAAEGKTPAGKAAATKAVAKKTGAKSASPGRSSARTSGAGPAVAKKKPSGSAAAPASTARSSRSGSTAKKAANTRAAGNAGPGQDAVDTPRKVGTGPDAGKPFVGAIASAASPVRQAAGGVPDLGQVSGAAKTGFVSNEAANAALESKLKEANTKSILGHVSSADRANQSKRDRR